MNRYLIERPKMQIIDELAANDSAIAFTAHNPVIRPNNATRSIVSMNSSHTRI